MYIVKIYVTASGLLKCPSVRAVPDGRGLAACVCPRSRAGRRWPPELTMASLGSAGLPPTSSRTSAPAQPL